MTLAQKLAADVISPVTLIEIQPKAKLEGFTLSGAYTYTYEVAWGYDPPSSVCEDGEALSEQTSIANVEANTGSWYYDGSKVYVHTTGDDNPSGYLITMRSKIRFCSGPKGFQEWDNKRWHPYITENGAPTLNDSLADIFSSTVNGNSISFTISNATGYLDSISRAYIWENALTTILWGLKDLSYSDFKTAFIGFLENPEWSEEEISFTATDQRRLFSEEELPETEFLQENYADLPDDFEGSDIPLYFGPHEKVTCVLIEDNDPTSWKFKIADHRLDAISTVYIGGVVTSSSNWTADLPNGEFTLTADPGTDEVTADIEGYHNGTSYIETGIEQALEIVKMSTLGSSLINETSFTDAAVENPAKTRLKVTNKTTIANILGELTLATSLIIDFDEDGKLAASTWNPEIPSDTPTFFKRDFLTRPKSTSKMENIYQKVIILYGEDTETDALREVAESEEVAILYQRKKTKEVATGLIEQTDAETLALRYSFYTSSRNMQVSAILGPRAMTLAIGSKVKLTSERGADESGEWDGKAFEVIEVSKNLNTFQVTVTLEDLKGLGSDIATYCPDTAVEYELSTKEEQDSQGYYGEPFIDTALTRKKYRI